MAPSPPERSGSCERSKSLVELSVDEASDRSDAGGVAAAMLAILLRERLVASQASDGVLDADAGGGKRRVVDHILGWSRLPAWLATRREAAAGGMERRHPDVRQVTQHADVRVEAVEEPGGFQHREVAGWAADALSGTSTTWPDAASIATWRFSVCCFFFPL